jgi:uncharacterized protein
VRQAIAGWIERDLLALLGRLGLEPMSTGTEAIGESFAAINRDDMQAITGYFDPEIVHIEPEGFPTAGTDRGIAELQEHVARGRGTRAKGTCEPEKSLVGRDRVVVYLHARVRPKDPT